MNALRQIALRPKNCRKVSTNRQAALPDQTPYIHGRRHVGDILQPWLGVASFDQSQVAPKLRFRVPAEDGSGDIRLKLEINTREIKCFDPPNAVSFGVNNPWFTGSVAIPTFSREELLATKLRALLQRDKGRDLLDLAHALKVFPELNAMRVVECFGLYLKQANQSISRAEAEQRMFAKLAVPTFLTDIGPLLSAEASASLSEDAVLLMFSAVFSHIIGLISGGRRKLPQKIYNIFNHKISKHWGFLNNRTL